MPDQNKSQTPVIDAAQFMPSDMPPAFNLAQYMVQAAVARKLELQNAALVAALERFISLWNAAYLKPAKDGAERCGHAMEQARAALAQAKQI